MLCNAVYPSNIWYSVVNILQVFHICRSTDTPPPPLTNTVESILSWGGGGEGGSEVARVTHFTQSPHINIYPRLAALLVNGKHRLSHVVCTSPPSPHPPPHSKLAPTVSISTRYRYKQDSSSPSQQNYYSTSPPQSRHLQCSISPTYQQNSSSPFPAELLLPLLTAG
jgi:hypothetical protein